MAFAVVALAAEGNTVIRNSDCAGVSFPTFFIELNRMADR
jgi:5-enolpyruvylshikimate-3-phosphate synthase